ncbi:MAG: lactate utilization protein [Deltaproteobacteria bacterium]|nr:lactate utilization protein [Deltaproteobacteria bacterium]
MEKPVDYYWKKRLGDLGRALEGNNFEVYQAADSAEAKKIAVEQIIPRLNARSVSWGGSTTFIATGLYHALRDDKNLDIIDTYNQKVSPEEKLERRRQSLTVDLFFTGTNAVTEEGILVNLDYMGNRVAAITFGPKNVVIFLGRNKIVSGLDEAMFRIKNYAAPINAMRLDMKTPCAKTSYCEECKGTDRICNSWTITEKSFPKGRIKVILINEDLGL